MDREREYWTSGLEEFITTEVTNANILGVRVATNCPQGGDAGHGGRTMLALTNQSSTAWAIEVVVDGRRTLVANPDEIVLFLAGDTEAQTFAAALEFAARRLTLEQRR